MAAANISCKHLILVALFLLCFVTVRARTLREANGDVVDKSHNDLLPSKGTDHEMPDVDELAGMDYTPARKKPPIHN
ncbi:hypothetical protein Tsubulata_013572 [Turnera subulata]|uniref:Root meristem growth factor 9 n=1 Tax=Turnera subulata TaxID=218843 RepID=A0A9Q0IYQ2_9ROSI|nr:hypothetical protein Tsubulata_013572 [Turnera subulata]